MYSTLITAVALFAAPAFVSAFAVNNPDLKQCATSKISWQKTEGPYNVIIVDAANPCGEPLVEVGDFEGSSVQWENTVLRAGQVVQVSIADKNDDEAWSGNITVAANTDSSCLDGGASLTDDAETPAADTPTSNTDSSSTSSPASGSGNAGSTPGGSSSAPGAGFETNENGELVPVGAANAGTNKVFNDNAAPSARTLSGSVMALSAIAAVAVLAL